jgi:hypothetical protein
MKKRLNKIVIPIAALILIVLVLSGCSGALVNDLPNLDPLKYGKIFMPQARKYPAKRSILLNSDSTQYFVYSASYGGPKRKRENSNIAVQFMINTALVDSFNTENGTSYQMLPKSAYKMDKLKAVIHSDELSTPKLKINIKVNGNIKGDGTQYLLPITMHVINSDGIKINKDLQTTYFLVQGSYREIAKTNWKIIDTDASAKLNYPAANLIDGNDDTFWNSKYLDPVDPLPHYFIIDMGETHKMYGFRIVARPAHYHQNPKEITIQFSSDGKTWRDGEDFTLPFNLDDQELSAKIFLSKPVTARYFKFIIRAVVKGGPIADFNEMYAF